MDERSEGAALKKSGQQRGADNVESLTWYLDELDQTGEMIPLNPDGGPNYSEIARHCGFGRQVFYTNEKVRALVEQDGNHHASSLGLSRPVGRSGFFRE